MSEETRVGRSTERARRPRPVLAAVLDRGRLAVASSVVAALGLAIGVSGTGAAGGAVPGPVPVASASAGCAPGWTAAWRMSPQATRADEDLGGSTLRMIVRPQVAGTEVRLRLSNAYGTRALRIGAVSVAHSDGAAGLVAGTARAVAFGGRPSVVVPTGEDVVSDPVPLATGAGDPVAVSVFLPASPGVVAQHPVALQTSYLSGAGDATLADGSGFTTELRSWLVLTGVDVLVPRPVNAVVAVGDSITDGVGSRIDADERWPDVLSDRLAAAGGTSTMSVLNAGISRNRLLADDPVRDGDSPLTRVDRDVTAARPTDVVLHIGTNDIAGGSGADELVAGLRRFAERVRADGRRVFLTTITPASGGPHGTAGAVATRDAVNAWVRDHGREHADGVFDFAAAVADPAAPSRLAPAFDAGDGLHLSAAGYRALAGAVDLAALTGSPCLADAAPAVRPGG